MKRKDYVVPLVITIPLIGEEPAALKLKASITRNHGRNRSAIL